MLDPNLSEELALLAKAKRAVRIWFVRGALGRLVSISTNLLLLALVSPTQLGILAVVRGTIGIVYFLSDLGFESALVRRPAPPSEAEMGALTGFRIVAIALILGAGFAIPQASTLFGTLAPQWSPWVLALLAAFLVTPMQLGSKIRLERNLEFGKLGFVEVSAIILENVGLVVAALLHRFEQGVFLMFMISFLYTTVIVHILAPSRGISLQVRHLRGIYADTVGFSIASFFTIARASITPIIIARLFGLDIAGVWAFAERSCSLLNLTFDSYARTGFAAAARFAHRPSHLLDLATSALSGTMTWGYPGAILVFAALPIVPSVWPQWAGAVVPAQTYVLGLGIFGVFSASLAPVAVAQRGPMISIAEQGVGTGVVWLALILLAKAGLTNVGIAYAVGTVATAIILIVLSDSAISATILPIARRPALGVAYSLGIFTACRWFGAGHFATAIVTCCFACVWLAPSLIAGFDLIRRSIGDRVLGRSSLML